MNENQSEFYKLQEQYNEKVRNINILLWKIFNAKLRRTRDEQIMGYDVKELEEKYLCDAKDLIEHLEKMSHKKYSTCFLHDYLVEDIELS